MQSPPAFKSIDAIGTKSRLDQGWNPFVLDVREAPEAAISSLDFTDQLQIHTGKRIIDHSTNDKDALLKGHRNDFLLDAII